MDLNDIGLFVLSVALSLAMVTAVVIGVVVFVMWWKDTRR